MADVVRAAGRHGVPLHARPEGIPAERGSGALQHQHAKRCRASASTTWCATSWRSRRSSRRIRTSSASPAPSGRAPAAAAAALNTGRIGVDLKPRDQRTLSVDQVIASLRPKLAQVPGMRVFMTEPAADQPRRTAGRTQPLSVHAAGYRYRRAVRVGAETRGDDARAAEARGRQQRSAAEEPAGHRRRLTATRLSTLGLNVNQVETALYNAYGTRQVTQIYAPNNQYQVVLQVAPEFQRDPAALGLLYVRSNAGASASRSTPSPRSRPTPGRSR